VKNKNYEAMPQMSVTLINYRMIIPEIIHRILNYTTFRKLLSPSGIKMAEGCYSVEPIKE
jgi:hypothetical protein